MKYVIGTSDAYFFECFSENGTIFLTKDLFLTERFHSESSAREMIKEIENTAKRFLNGNYEEFNPPGLKVFQLKLSVEPI